MLAVVRATGTLSFDQLLTLEGDQLTRGTMIVAVTPSTRDTWTTAAHRLLQRGLRMVSVIIDAGSFGGRPGAEQTAARLQTVNIPTYIIRQHDDLRVKLSEVYR